MVIKKVRKRCGTVMKIKKRCGTFIKRFKKRCGMVIKTIKTYVADLYSSVLFLICIPCSCKLSLQKACKCEFIIIRLIHIITKLRLCISNYTHDTSMTTSLPKKMI